MNYKSWYRTYRPKNFDEVLGQEHVVSTLKNIIKKDKIGHAYLFSGPRGTGKTSVAHIFSKEVNKNEIGEEVIGEMDIIEIDAASNNGVAEVRSIINNVHYSPTKCKYKVYIIDEVHMLTKGAFNALLKTLEEPPKHTIFIFATTEPYKIPITILSRVQRFNFRRIEESVIVFQLSKILEKENIEFDNKSIKYIAKLSQGGLRDALSISEQASIFGDGKISFEVISKVFGLVSIENEIKILNLAYENSSFELMNLLNQFLESGVDIEKFSISLLDILKDFIIFNKTKKDNLMSFIDKEQSLQINIDIEYAYFLVDILFKLISDLKFSSMPRQLLELSILKMLNLKKNISEKQNYKIQKQENINKETKKNILNKNHDLKFDKFIKLDKQENIHLNKQKNNNKIEDIINLLVQTNKTIIEKTKNKFKNLNDFLSDNNFHDFVQLLNETKIISAGTNFILLGSEKKYIVDGINLEKENKYFINLIKKILGDFTWVFVITKEEFVEVKKRWQNLSLENKLPKPKLIKPFFIKELEKSEEEKYGENLFKDIFTS